jgi:extradiol dioxygenase family protein
MGVHTFGHFNLRADAALMARLRDFYVDVVGLADGWRPPFAFPGHWLYLGGQAVLHLAQDDAITADGLAARRSFDHVAFNCSGLVAFEARLTRAGVAYRRARVPGTSQLQLFVSDPAGHGVEFNFDLDAEPPGAA